MKKLAMAAAIAAFLLAMLVAVSLRQQAKQTQSSREWPQIFLENQYPIFLPGKDQLWEAGTDEETGSGGEAESGPAELEQEEDAVYAFLQGPKSYERKQSGSGDWALANINGNNFSSFGCGACCMANIYSTLSPYECSPLEMCEFAMEHTGYRPDAKAGAIGWGDMESGLQAAGVECALSYKPEEYAAFQQTAAGAESMVVLVSSAEDDTFWKNTYGHYVNLWLYEEETDTVFLAEPGNPDTNRTRIPLRYVYDALKTASDYQVLVVEGYTEENDIWKHSGIGGTWYS